MQIISKFRLFLIQSVLLATGFVYAQAPIIDAYINEAEVRNHIEYLASDALQGRNTGTPGNILAAEYIAAHFKKHGVNKLNGTDGYFQSLPMKKLKAGTGHITLNNTKFVHGENMIFLNGDPTALNTSVVFLGSGENQSFYTKEQA